MNKKLRIKIIEEYGTQSDFAQAIKVNESVISRVVRGRRSLSPEGVKLWSRALKCDPSILQGQAG